MATSNFSAIEQLSSDDTLCKKLLHELLRNQSVASWAASAVTALDNQESATSERSLPSPPNPRRGQAIVGRRERNDDDGLSIESSSSTPFDQGPVSPAVPQLDPLTIDHILRSLSADKSSVSSHRHESDCGSEASSETSSLAGMSSVSGSFGLGNKLERSMSVPSEKYIGFNGMNMDRYKTELCRQHQETGFCKYGAKCQFAHGHAEIRTVSRHPRYKTEMCRTYHTTGLCPYGTRCHFIHDEDETQLKLQQQQRMASRHSSVGRQQTRDKASGLFNPAVGSPFAADTVSSLGSVGDTPPSSINSSPAPSPTAFLQHVPCDVTTTSSLDCTHSLPLSFASSTGHSLYGAPPGFAPPTAPAIMTSPVFDFKDVPTPSSSFQAAIPSPITIQTPTTADLDPVQSLAAGLQAATPSYDKDLVRDCFTDFYMAYTDVETFTADSDNESCLSDSGCSSTLSASLSSSADSRKSRLPVFSKFATPEQ